MPSLQRELAVVVVANDAHVRAGCLQALQASGFAAEAVDAADAVRETADVVVVDMLSACFDALALVRRLHERDQQLPVIVISGHGDARVADDAMQSGAYDILPRPFSLESLVEFVRRAADKRRLTLELNALRTALSHSEGIASGLLGRSPAMARVRRRVAELANASVDVLITGEPGTGKQHLARALHAASARQGGAFVAMRLDQAPDELSERAVLSAIEQAHGGTLFLDDIANLSLGVQRQLLHVLQDRCLTRPGSDALVPVDLRLIAATTEDMSACARDGRFLADLHGRLRIGAVELPPLRERPEDIPMLLEHFVLLAASRFGRAQPTVTRDAMTRLLAHPWPGNVQELRSTADRLVLGIATMAVEPGPAQASIVSDDASLPEIVERFESSLIAAQLSRHKGSVAESARALGIEDETLSDKIRRYGL